MSEYIAYDQQPGGAACHWQYPHKQAWQYQKEANGKITLMKRVVGGNDAVAILAKNFIVGAWTHVTADCACPISGYYYADRMQAEQVDVGVYEIKRWWSRGGDDNSSSVDTGWDCTDYDEISYQAQSIGVAERIKQKYPCVCVAALEAFIGALPLGKECAQKIADEFGFFVCLDQNKRAQIISAIRAGSYWVYMPVAVRVQKTANRPSNVGDNVGKRTTPQMKTSYPSGFKWLQSADTVSWDGTYWVRRREWLGAKCWSCLLYDEA